MKKSLIVSTVLALAVVACMALPGNAFAGTKYTGIVQFEGCNWQQCSQGATAMAISNTGQYAQTNVYFNGALWVYTFETGVGGFDVGWWHFCVSNCNCCRQSDWSPFVQIDGIPCSPLPECGLPFKLNICASTIPCC